MSTQKQIQGLEDSKDNSLNCTLQIIKMLQSQAMYPREILSAFNGQYNLVTIRARLCELYDEGIVSIATVFDDQSTESCYRLTYSHEKDQVILDRENERFKRWLNNAAKFQNRMPSDVMRWIELEAKI